MRIEPRVFMPREWYPDLGKLKGYARSLHIRRDGGYGWTSSGRACPRSASQTVFQQPVRGL